MGTGKILIDGTETFVPVFNRLREIAQEFIPYFIYIAIGALGISLLWKAVKYILNYQKTKTTQLFNRREDRIYDTYEKSDFEKGLEKDGVNTLFGDGEVVRTEKKAYKGEERNYER